MYTPDELKQIILFCDKYKDIGAEELAAMDSEESQHIKDMRLLADDLQKGRVNSKLKNEILSTTPVSTLPAVIVDSDDTLWLVRLFPEIYREAGARFLADETCLYLFSNHHDGETPEGNAFWLIGERDWRSSLAKEK